MSSGTGIGDSAEGEDSQNTLQKHTAIGNRFCITFLIQLLGGGSGGYQGMEAGYCTAGNSSKQNREEILHACLGFNSEAGKCRKQLWINIWMCTNNANKCDKEH